MAKFKVGDKVRCIKNNSVKHASGYGWDKDKEFIINSIMIDATPCICYFPKHGYGVFETHLELAQKDFKEWDKVKCVGNYMRGDYFRDGRIMTVNRIFKSHGRTHLEPKERTKFGNMGNLEVEHFILFEEVNVKTISFDEIREKGACEKGMQEWFAKYGLTPVKTNEIDLPEFCMSWLKNNFKDRFECEWKDITSRVHCNFERSTDDENYCILSLYHGQIKIGCASCNGMFAGFPDNYKVELHPDTGRYHGLFKIFKKV